MGLCVADSFGATQDLQGFWVSLFQNPTPRLARFTRSSSRGDPSVRSDLGATQDLDRVGGLIHSGAWAKIAMQILIRKVTGTALNA